MANAYQSNYIRGVQQEAGQFDAAKRYNLSNLQALDQADSLNEARRMREITRKQAELGLQQQQQALADRRNPDGSIKTYAEYAFDLEKRKGEFNDSIAQRGWRTRQQYAEEQRQKVNNEQRATATELAQKRMGRRVNVAIPTAS
jgi:hypothetical protein